MQKKRRPRTTILPSTEGIPRDGVLFREQVMQLFGASKTKLRDLMLSGDVPMPEDDSPFARRRIWKAQPVWEAYGKFFGIEVKAA